jgi:hypothetical protein
VGVVVKHSQLARQVGELIEDPPENSMASFNFINAVLDKGTTFNFGSWICVADGLGGFNSYLANSKEPEASSSTSSSDLDDFIDNLDDTLLPDLAQQIEKMSFFNSTSTRDAPVLLGSDLNQSDNTSRSKSLSDLKEDLDLLLQIKDVGTTASRETPVFDIYSDSDEEYSTCGTTSSSWIQKRLGDVGTPSGGLCPRKPLATRRPHRNLSG